MRLAEDLAVVRRKGKQRQLASALGALEAGAVEGAALCQHLLVHGQHLQGGRGARGWGGARGKGESGWGGGEPKGKSTPDQIHRHGAADDGEHNSEGRPQHRGSQ